MTSRAVNSSRPACVLADGSQIPCPGLALWQVPQRASVRERLRGARYPVYRHIRHSPAHGNEEIAGGRCAAAACRETRCSSAPILPGVAARGPGRPWPKTPPIG